MLLITLPKCLSRCYTLKSFGKWNWTELKLFPSHYPVKVLLLSQSPKFETVRKLLAPQCLPYSISHTTKPCQLNMYSISTPIVIILKFHSQKLHPLFKKSTAHVNFIKTSFHMNYRSLVPILWNIIIIKYLHFPKFSLTLTHDSSLYINFPF